MRRLFSNKVGGMVVLLYSVFVSGVVIAQQGSTDWAQITAQAGWLARERPAVVSFRDSLWIMGGVAGTTRFNDVWCSADGVNWVQAPNAGWSGRYGHAAVVYKGRIWVLGGFSGAYRSDVWSSVDGRTWIQDTSRASWSPRYHHTVVVLRDTLWLMGGYDGTNYLNDVWYSTNGKNWTQATAAAGWSARRWHATLAYDNRLWVLGGSDTSGTLGDVWYSSNGSVWTRASDAAWPRRSRLAAVVFDGKMWVLGGFGGITYRNDVWYSTDGAGWTQVTNAPWTARYFHGSAVHADRMWVMAGFAEDTTHRNDVWASAGRGLTVVVPNGGETWSINSNQTIRWRSYGSGIARYRVLLSRDGGSNYAETVAVNITPPETTYRWRVTPPTSAACRMRVQALSATNALLVQDISDANFAIASQQPSVFRLSSPPNRAWAGSRPTFVWYASTALESLRYQLYIDRILRKDSIRDTVYTLTGVGLSETTHTWYVRALTSSGSSRYSADTFLVRIDSMPPRTFSLRYPEDSVWTTGESLLFAWQPSADVRSGLAFYQLLIDGEVNRDSIPWSDTVTTCRGILSDGYHSWAIRAVDSAGNFRNSSQTRTVFVDATPPDTFSLAGPGDDDTVYVQQPVLSWHPTRDSGSGLDRYQLWLNGELNRDSISPSDTMTVPSHLLPYGSTHSWTVKAIDRTGWVREANQAWTLHVVQDTVAPTVPTLIAPLDSSFVSESLPRFCWHSSFDRLSGVDNYTLEYAPNPAFSNSVRVEVYDTIYRLPYRLADTTWYWRVQALDRMGNVSDWSAVWRFELDTRSPSVPSLVRPTGGVWSNVQRTVFEWTAVTFGLLSPVRYIVQIDTTPSFSSPLVDTAAINQDTIALAERTRYYWRVRAFDLAGNQGGWSSVDSFGCDWKKPTTPVLVAPDSGAARSDSVVTFVWRSGQDSVSGVRHYLLQYANEPTFARPVSRDSLADTVFVCPVLADTVWYWRVRTTDRAGNHSNWSAVWVFEKDTRVPAVPSLLAPIGGIWLRDSVVVFRWSEVSSARAGNVILSPVRYILQVDTSRLFSAPVLVDTQPVSTDTVKLEASRYYWRVRAFDLAGNKGNWSGVDSFGCDWTPPTLPMPSWPPDDTTLADTVFGFFWYPAQDRPSGVAYYQFQLSLDPIFAVLVRDTVVLDTSYRIRLVDTVYYWRVRAADRAGNRSVWSSVRKLRTRRIPGVKEDLSLPVTALERVNPTLFRDRLEVEYALARASLVRLVLHNSLGREIAVLAAGRQDAGTYRVSWRGGAAVPAGIYFVRLDTEGVTVRRKVTRLR